MGLQFKNWLEFRSLSPDEQNAHSFLKRLQTGADTAKINLQRLEQRKTQAQDMAKEKGHILGFWRDMGGLKPASDSVCQLCGKWIQIYGDNREDWLVGSAIEQNCEE